MELLARVKAQLRRYVRLGGIEPDDESKRVTLDGDLFKVTLHFPE